MAHRVATLALLIAGARFGLDRPLVGFILVAAGLVVLVDSRAGFGRGVFRSMIAFIASLWMVVIGVGATLLGVFALPGTCDTSTTICDDPESNFLFLPGVLLLVLGLTLLMWSVAVTLQARRARSSRPPA